MNSNIKKEQFENSYQLQQETRETKKFFQDVFQIDYINTSKIFNQLSQKSAEVKVNNYLCYQQGQILYKITEILYKDKLIRIQDKFQVRIDPTHEISNQSLAFDKGQKKIIKCSGKIQKVRIFNKNIKNVIKSEKKDKKNIVKNIVKLFMSWLEKKQEENYYLVGKQVVKMLSSQNFNNRLIQKIISNKQISKVFLEFIQIDAGQQIKCSRIQDKQSHYQALQIYKNLLSAKIKEISQSSRCSLEAGNQLGQCLQQEDRFSDQKESINQNYMQN